MFANQLSKSTILGTVLFDGFEAACNVLPPQNEGSVLAFPRLADFWDGLSRWYTFTGVDAAFFGGMAAGALHGTLSVAWDNTVTSVQRLWKNRRMPQALLNPATTVVSREAAKSAAAAAIGPSLHGTILSHMLFHATLFGTFAGIMAVVREAGLDSDHSITRKDVMREMQERSFARLPARRQESCAIDNAAGSVHRDEPSGESGDHLDSNVYDSNLSESGSDSIDSEHDKDDNADNDDDNDDDEDGHALQLVAAVGVAGAIAGVASEIVAVATAPWEVHHAHHRATRTPPPHPIAHKFELFHSALRVGMLMVVESARFRSRMPRLVVAGSMCSMSSLTIALLPQHFQAPGAVRGVLLSGILSGALGFLAYEFADL